MVMEQAVMHAETAETNDGFQIIEACGVKLRVYTRSLENAGLPLLICNGLGQSVELLFPLMDQMPDRPIIAFDAAGIGHSELPTSKTTIPQHAEMVAEILAKLEVPQVDVLGISWGGALTQQLAHTYPDLCRRLILSITSTGGLITWWGSPIALFEIQFPFRFSNKAYGNFIGPWMYGGEAISNPELFKEYSKHAVAPSYKGYSAQVQAMCRWSSLSWVHSLKQKTLVISGLYDALIPAVNQAALATLIPNSTLATYPAGHLLMYSQREDVARKITAFLK